NIDNNTVLPRYFYSHFAESSLNFPDFSFEHPAPYTIKSEADSRGFAENQGSEALALVRVGNYGKLDCRSPFFHNNVLQEHIQSACFKELISNVFIELRTHVIYIGL